MTDLANQFMRSHFGLGSSTRGMTMDEANKGRSEAEARADCRRPFEPDEYWINVFWDYKRERLVSETNFTEVADAYEDILAGYEGCQYLHTIKTSKTGNRGVRDTSAFNLEDDARAWAKESANG